MALAVRRSLGRMVGWAAAAPRADSASSAVARQEQLQVLGRRSDHGQLTPLGLRQRADRPYPQAGDGLVVVVQGLLPCGGAATNRVEPPRSPIGVIQWLT